MATIYEFIVRDQTKNGKQEMIDPDTGEVIGKKSVAKEKPLSGSNKGVDHNRYMRAVNPLINRYVPGFEKYVRGGRAIVGVFDTLVQTGITSAMTSVGAIVLLELALTKLDDLRREKIEETKKENIANYNKLITGQTQLSQNVKATKNIWGKITFKNQ